MRRAAIFMLCVTSLFVTQGAYAFSCSVTPQEITISCKTPEKEEMGEFSLFLKTSDTSWILLGALEKPIPQGTVSLKIPQSKEPVLLSHKPTPILWGREALPEGAQVNFTLLFSPSWAMEAGAYTSRLVFHYQKEGAPPLPIPQGVSLTLEVSKAFAVEIQGACEGIVFEISGPPGIYPLAEPMILSARANVTPWALFCTTQGLSGEKGGHIPPSRIFVEVEGRRYSLEKPVPISTTRAGEAVTQKLSFFVETTSSDPPGRYTGEVAFGCSFGTKGGIL